MLGQPLEMATEPRRQRRDVPGDVEPLVDLDRLGADRAADRVAAIGEAVPEGADLAGIASIASAISR
jgi:hypothetical protein